MFAASGFHFSRCQGEPSSWPGVSFLSSWLEETHMGPAPVFIPAPGPSAGARFLSGSPPIPPKPSAWPEQLCGGHAARPVLPEALVLEQTPFSE